MDERDNRITYFAQTDFRNQKTKFGIKEKDRTRHMYIIGKTGMGKSTMLENLAIQDIQNGEGVIFIDPHGAAAEKLLEFVPKSRMNDVIYFCPSDAEYPIAFNVLEDVPRDKRNSVASGLMNAFKKIWVDAWSSRMEYLLNYTLLALLDVPETTLLSINRLLSDKDYRNAILEKVQDPIVINFWKNEFTKYNDKYATEAVAPIQNKVGQFISNPMIRNIIGQEDSSIDFRRVMDERKILIVNLSKGLIGPDNMKLIGGMIVTKIYLAAMSRANLSSAELSRMPACHLYVDEFQNFANESFAEILSESRKYKLALTVANQYIEQMTDEVKAAIFGNVGSLVAFRVGSTDAELLEKEFAPNFLAEDLVNLGFTQNYLKLMIDGIGSKPFSSESLTPIPALANSFVPEIIANSRKYFAFDKKEVEEKIESWSKQSFEILKERKKDIRESKEVPDVKEEKPFVIPILPSTFVKKEDRVKTEEEKIEKPKRKTYKKEEEVKIGNNFADAIKKAMEQKSDVEEIKEAVEKKSAKTKIEKINQDIENKSTLKDIINEEIKNTKDLPHRGRAKIKAQETHIQKPLEKEKIDEVPEDVLSALLNTQN